MTTKPVAQGNPADTTLLYVDLLYAFSLCVILYWTDSPAESHLCLHSSPLPLLRGC